MINLYLYASLSLSMAAGGPLGVCLVQALLWRPQIDLSSCKNLKNSLCRGLEEISLKLCKTPNVDSIKGTFFRFSELELIPFFYKNNRVRIPSNPRNINIDFSVSPRTKNLF